MGEWTLEDLEAAKRRNPDLAERNLGTSDLSAEYFRMTNPPKYHAKKTDGYASKKEAEFAAKLALRQKAGEVWFWLEQVSFKLPGGTKHRVDFLVFYHRDYYGRYGNPWELVEVKGKDLPLGKLKRKQVEELYGVQITVV